MRDIDLSLVLEFRDDDIEKRSKRLDERIKLAKKQGRRFKDFFNERVWPYEEVRRFLRNRSSFISIHNEEHDHILSKDIPSKIIFDISKT